MKLPKGRRRPRIGRLPYLIAAPFTFDWPDEDVGVELITAPPRQLAHLARQDELDAACIPLSDVRSLNRRFEPLGDLGLALAAGGPTALFFSRIEADLLGNAPLGVCAHGASTVSLLELILMHRYGVDKPNIVPLSPDRRRLGGLLKVGDQAIGRMEEITDTFPQRYDLVAEWCSWTGLPFVLSRWLVRKSLSDAFKDSLLETVNSSLQAALQQRDTLVASHLKEQSLQWETDPALSYLQTCHYHIGDDEQKAMDLFHKHVREMTPQENSWRDLL